MPATIHKILAERAGRLAAATDDNDRLRLIRVEIGETEADLQRLGQERQDYAVAVLAGDAAAIAARRALDQDIELLHVRLADLRAALAQAEADRRAAAAAEHVAMQSARRRQTAAGHAGLSTLAVEIQALAEQLGVRLRACRDELLALAAVSGVPQVKRFADGLPLRLQSCLARYFLINIYVDGDPAKPAQPRTDNNLLGLQPEPGELGRRPLQQFIQDLLDDTAPVFGSEAEAAACRERLKARKTRAVVLPLIDGLWLVLPLTQVFNSEAAARSALASVMSFRQEPHQALEYRGVWLVLRPDLAEALAPEPAEAA